ncbi:MAG: hypothetical protein RI973_1788 [Bacteroidota bacterium]|jgi:uncharacterized protein (DUF1501 family)
MKRRQFIQTTGLSLPVLLNGFSLRAMPGTSLFSAVANENDRVLVLIQLNGGNDGLAMITPLDQYDKLANARNNILISSSQLLETELDNAFHPVMTGIKSVFDEGKLRIVQSVGYPNQNRSHFRSTDIWTSGSPADEVWTTGWLGRYFQKDHPDFPNDYPNADAPHPFALTIGSLVSETCQGSAANFSLAINDPFNLNPLIDQGGGSVPATPYGLELTFLRDSIAQTNAYSEVITDVAANGTNLASYPDGNRLAQQLKNVALLISGGLQTKVYIVSLGGFDTHANQVVDGSPGAGEHAVLLQTLSEAVQVFMQDLKLQGLENRVLTMTFSEFGRRIRSNDSLGTDHGDAAPLLLFGSCVAPGFLGDNPAIPANPDIIEAVPMQYDFRDVYGSVLMDWFGVAEADVKNLLYPDFTPLPLIAGCTTVAAETAREEEFFLQASPNPFGSRVTVSFSCAAERVHLSLFNSMGQELQVLLSQRMTPGVQELEFDGSHLSAGAYYLHLRLERGRQKVYRLVKAR